MHKRVRRLRFQVFSSISTLTNAAGALAAACVYAAAALSTAVLLHVLAIIYVTRAYRGLPGVRDECCICLCCDCGFCNRAPAGRRLCARVASAALHGVLCALLFSAAGNFGTQVWPVIKILTPIIAGVGGAGAFTLAGQSLAYAAGALAFLACASDVIGIAAGARTTRGGGKGGYDWPAPPSALASIAVSTPAPTAPVHSAPPLVLQQEAASLPQARFCSACGAQRVASARFCPTCGHSHVSSTDPV